MVARRIVVWRRATWMAGMVAAPLVAVSCGLNVSGIGDAMDASVADHVVGNVDSAPSIDAPIVIDEDGGLDAGIDSTVTSQVDAGIDSPVDAPPDTNATCDGFTCGSTCIPSSSTCNAACPNARLACGHQCVAACDECTTDNTPAPVACFYCTDITNPTNVNGATCTSLQNAGSAAGACNYSATNSACTCVNTPDCVGATSSCISFGTFNLCIPCGDFAGSEAQTCKGGGQCAQTSTTAACEM